MDGKHQELRTFAHIYALLCRVAHFCAKLRQERANSRPKTNREIVKDLVLTQFCAKLRNEKAIFVQNHAHSG